MRVDEFVPQRLRARCAVAAATVVLVVAGISALSNMPLEDDPTNAAVATDNAAPIALPRVDPGATSDALANWSYVYLPLVFDVARATQQLSDDARATDFDAVGVDCRDVSGLIDRLGAGMPVPGQADTSRHLANALNSYRSAMRDCVAAVHNLDAATLSRAEATMTAGTAELGRATESLHQL